MIRSMTGFGQASAECPGMRATVELRSLNNRFVDVRLRLPAELTARESSLRRRVAERVRRGRVEGSFDIEWTGEREPRVSVHVGMVRGLRDAAQRLRDELGLDGRLDLSTVLGLPGVVEFQLPQEEWTDDRLETLERALDGALDALVKEKQREGVALREDLLPRLDRMAELADSIASRGGEVPARQRQKLVDRLTQFAESVELDPARIAQEAALLADRADVTEELVRLRGHLGQARALLAEPDGEPVGKRLEFLLQEIHRETNTVNSKSPDLEITRWALELKAESEKVREQVHNLE